MHLKYIHYFGNESNESILEAYGLRPKSEEIRDKMKPRQCPNCSELNKIDSKFCVKCRMILSYDSYMETINKSQIEEQKKQDKLDWIMDKIKKFEERFGEKEFNESCSAQANFNQGFLNRIKEKKFLTCLTD